MDNLTHAFTAITCTHAVSREWPSGLTLAAAVLATNVQDLDWLPVLSLRPESIEAHRGYLRVVAERSFRTWWAAAIAVSAVFGWAHAFYGWYGGFYTGLNGLAFALLARATGSLYVVILAHTCFDALVFAAG